MKKGFNIDVTQGQYMMLYNIMCEHNQMVNPQANPDFDLQTFDNLFQAITMAKETYLNERIYINSYFNFRYKQY